MNYDQVITDLIAALKADKDISQPWKNYAMSDALRLQAVIQMGRNTTRMEPPAEMEIPQGFPDFTDSSADCICEPSNRHEYCPATKHVA